MSNNRLVHTTRNNVQIIARPSLNLNHSTNMTNNNKNNYHDRLKPMPITIVNRTKSLILH